MYAQDNRFISYLVACSFLVTIVMLVCLSFCIHRMWITSIRLKNLIHLVLKCGWNKFKVNLILCSRTGKHVKCIVSHFLDLHSNHPGYVAKMYWISHQRALTATGRPLNGCALSLPSSTKKTHYTTPRWAPLDLVMSSPLKRAQTCFCQTQMQW